MVQSWVFAFVLPGIFYTWMWAVLTFSMGEAQDFVLCSSPSFWTEDGKLIFR